MEFPLQRMQVSERVFEESPPRDASTGRKVVSPHHPEFSDPPEVVVGQSERLIPEPT